VGWVDADQSGSVPVMKLRYSSTCGLYECRYDRRESRQYTAQHTTHTTSYIFS